MKPYVRHLRLKYDPFADEFQRDDFYGGGNRDNLLYSVLDYGHREVSLDALVGPAGSGKSRLAYRLCECAPADSVPASVAVNLFTSAEQLLGDVLRELEISPPADLADGLNLLSEYAINQALAGKSILLIIDNAHELGGDCVRLVERLLANHWSAIHLVLLGEEQLTAMLRARLRERYQEKLAVHELPGLNRVETAEYIHLKLARAGHGRNISMTSQAALDVLQQSGGLPRKINKLTAAMLDSQAHDAGTQAPQQSSDPEQARQPVERPEIRYLLHAFALGLVLAAVVFWPTETPDVTAPPAQPAVQTQPIALPATARPAPATAGAGAGSQGGTAAGSPADAIPVLSQFELLLLDTSPDNFTVQLVGSTSEEGVLEFIAAAQLGGVHGYYETRRGRNPWFIVVDGIYPDWEAAMEARTRLAQGADREDEPWIRRISNVHAEIARSGKRAGC